MKACFSEHYNLSHECPYRSFFCCPAPCSLQSATLHDILFALTMKSRFLFVHLALLPYAVLAQTCYNTAGIAITDPEVVPCAISPVKSLCCYSNRTLPAGGPHEKGNTADECLASGICQNRFTFEGKPGTTYWLEHCTDRDIESGNCMDICRSSRGPSGTAMITPCDGTNKSEKWCCGDTTACCANANRDLVTFPMEFVGMINGTIASLVTTPTPTPTPTPGFVSSATTTTGTPLPTSTSSAPSAAPQNTGLSTGAKAGIAIGAVLGVLALIGVGFFARKALAWKKEAEGARAANLNTPSYADLYPSKYEHSGFAPTELPSNPPAELAAPDVELGVYGDSKKPTVANKFI